MRGRVASSSPMFFAIDLEERIRPDHPLRPIRRIVDRILGDMTADFDAAYADVGRPGVPPERLLKLMLLQALYGVSSEAKLFDRLDTDLVFRWFCGMDPAEPVPAATAFTHNRDRLIKHKLAEKFFTAVTKLAIDTGKVSTEHFSVDGTLIESHGSIKSFVPNATADAAQARKQHCGGDDQDHDKGPGGTGGFKSRNPEQDFHGQKRSNATHRSVTDPEAKLYRKGDGQPAKLSHMGHLLVDNRSGIIVGMKLSEANGFAERETALELVDTLKTTHGISARTVGADAGYDAGAFLRELEDRGATPHVAPSRERRPGGRRGPKKADRPKLAARLRNFRRKLRDRGYAISQRKRKKVEEPFGWLKSHALLSKARLVGRKRIQQQWHIAAAGLTLVRLRNLMAA
ncbi:IS5 family transposase [Phycisphaera mikurensis]|uniref:Putative transposase for insertion sequence element n=1 Tax=Phycisphaera mikurensis (strain NBRC 102666 / KCTC 22515 / FYK2301M01) TaxID=1142394 RepID=I0IBR2_PHYMF|nr:IS5 family transposase [Phycisphaera mikurensis]BAM02700.1 putative transposase for insertion sequence element [Phycisphaera mikurensis NBRC 102666]BAM05321.1 putative transposase for insertion sequence element [Phycisphaera mikurensis NBRC 102666]